MFFFSHGRYPARQSYVSIPTEAMLEKYIRKAEQMALQKNNDFLTRAGNGRQVRNMRTGEVIFQAGDAADAVFYIIDGRVKLAQTSEQGKEAIFAVQEAGDFFGEGCLNGLRIRVTTATALEPSVLMAIPRDDMTSKMDDDREFFHFVFNYLLHHSAQAEENLVNQLLNDTERRLANLLLRQARFGQNSGPIPVRLSQEDMALMVGTSRPTINIHIKKFVRLGFISRTGTRAHWAYEINASLLQSVLAERAPGDPL
jgi:CRP/FNR family cyclic AMP-dependent transcriptional regulator